MKTAIELLMEQIDERTRVYVSESAESRRKLASPPDNIDAPTAQTIKGALFIMRFNAYMTEMYRLGDQLQKYVQDGLKELPKKE